MSDMLYKLYVKVNADHNPDGTCKPLRITFSNGAYVDIDRVKCSCRAASTKVGGIGTRYTIQVLGRETFLFDEENGKWFIEAKPRLQER